MKFINKIRRYFIYRELDELESYLRVLQAQFYSCAKVVVIFPWHSYYNDPLRIKERIMYLNNKLEFGD